MFSVTQNGVELDKSKYNWDEEEFSTNEDNLVLDFSSYLGITFKTGSNCVFKTRNYCTFNTGSNCVFKTGYYSIFETGRMCTFTTGDYCTFKTGSNCTFATGHSCKFNTDNCCTFNTGDYCIFNTDSNCTFATGHSCILKTGHSCILTKCAHEVFIEIPINKTIKLNGDQVSGYTEIKKEIKETNCNGKIVVIDGKEYVLQLKG